MSVTPIKWTSVELLHNVRKTLDSRREYVGASFRFPIVTYRAKVKLDGTNGAVQLLPDGRVAAQSRTRIISTGDDNMGFARWVEDNRDYFSALARSGEHRVIYGEWCGRGIQQRTAISRLDSRVFAVFAIQYHEREAPGAGVESTSIPMLEIDPERIRGLLPEHPELFVLPWYGPSVTLDFADREALKSAADTIDRMVGAVEECDPWVHETFGVSGLGEGLVMYPQHAGGARVTRDGYTELMFKAKGAKHQVVKQKNPAQLDPEVAASVAEFVELFATPARLEQGVNEACGGVRDLGKMGPFLKWFGQDVKKECRAELEASALEWKQVSRALTHAARDWYRAEVEKV